MATSRGRRAGLIDQRDRGRKRHKDIADATSPVGERERPGYAEALEGWLPSFVSGLAKDGAEVTSAGLQSFSIKQYLQESARFEVSADDRLRFLAIAIEELQMLAELDVYRRWQSAERLYKEAIRLDPNYATHRTSRALTALYLSDDTDEPRRSKMLTVACEQSALATRLGPTAHAFSVAGQCHYQLGATEAIDFYRKALQLDPQDPWPCLYVAYCLHDLEQWDEAAEAYLRVPQDNFVGPLAWRMDLLREQRADCLRRSGATAEALVEFESILDRYEKVPQLAEMTDMRYLREACEEWPEFRPRIEAIEARSGTEPR